jgi:hypothetical protein
MSLYGIVRWPRGLPVRSSRVGINDSIAQAYRIYHSFLAAGSPCELNIDYQLRNSLITQMTKAVSQNATKIDTLEEVIFLFEEAQDVVCKLMASVSLI